MSHSEEELERMVDEGQISEEKALAMLEVSRPIKGPRNVHKDLNKAYKDFRGKRLDEETFYAVVLKYITMVVKSHSHDPSTFSSIEDAITNTATKVWRHLDKFQAERSSFKRFVTVVTLSEIRNILDNRALRPFYRHRHAGRIFFLCRECHTQYDKAFDFCEGCGNGRLERTSRMRVSLQDAETLPAKGLSSEQRILFDEWLNRLTDTDRAIVRMLQDGLTQEEIGSALGITQQAVAQRLSRIRTEEKSPL